MPFHEAGNAKPWKTPWDVPPDEQLYGGNCDFSCAEGE